MTKLSAILFILFSTTYASASCTFSAEEHPESNMGYEVGFNCKQIKIIADASTRLQYLGSDNGECSLISSKKTAKSSVMILSMDASKEDTMMGDGCRVKTTFGNSSSRTIYFSAVEN